MLLCLLTVACPAFGLAKAVSPSEVDSLLKAYEQADEVLRTDIGRKLIDRCMADDPLTSSSLPMLNEHTPRDSADLVVWFAAERYYFNHSYFTEGIERSGLVG